MGDLPKNVPPFLAPIYENDPELYAAVMDNMETFIPEEGAIPKKYRVLMSMIADGVLDGVDEIYGQHVSSGGSDRYGSDGPRSRCYP